MDMLLVSMPCGCEMLLWLMLQNLLHVIHKFKLALFSCGFVLLCYSSGLTDKKCVPCNLKELRPMSEDSAQTLMPQVPEWNLVNDGGVMKLRRSWTVIIPIFTLSTGIMLL
ncbi:uncharacterized protein LOC108336350 isoform X3 [Vigna angularis]|uniref:uncharacterized protein LOC108336350 isoform X3 n=1 Tax=Phaseolus angularis TaxID=3914 RepID=UPI000809B584|nr:uncharacterized protein LOC108336350 isoform X3 [Vigna angularis]